MSTANHGHGWATSRKAPRYSSLRDLSVTYEGDSENVATHPPDISTEGMFINTSRIFPEGAVLNVHFRLAETGIEVRARGEVRDCLAGVGVGVEFVEISPDAVRAIEEEIRTDHGATTRRRTKPKK
jgi:hypothetical protein